MSTDYSSAPEDEILEMVMIVMQFLICKMEILYGENFLWGADFYFKLVVKKICLLVIQYIYLCSV